MRPELLKFPAEFVDKLKKIIPPGIFPEVAKGYMFPHPVTFRVNTLKADASMVKKDLSALGLVMESFNELPNAFILKEGSFQKLAKSKSYDEGGIYMQGLTSQVPPFLLAPKPGDRVLDLAAAPGGKTTQMAALMKNEGEIVAVEPDKMRYRTLVANIKKQGASIANPLLMNGLMFNEVESFDCVLLDAPCSSEGTFYVRDNATFKNWSPDFVTQMSGLQKKLMQVALNALKPGGRLVYSTCALSPEENEEVVSDALSQNSTIQLLPIPFKFPWLKPVFGQWNGYFLHKMMTHCRRIYPSILLEGFFVGVFKKN